MANDKLIFRGLKIDKEFENPNFKLKIGYVMHNLPTSLL